MKKEKYSGSGKGQPKLKDMHSDKGFGPSEASKQKQAPGSAHKQISGTAEMLNSAPSSARHKGVKGPNEMKDSKGGSAGSKPSMKGVPAGLEKGFKSLGKIESVTKHESNEQKDGVKKPKVSGGMR